MISRLLQGLPEEDARRVIATAGRRTFARGEVVFHEGDAANSLHVIMKGRVAVRTATPLGDTATLAVLGPGDTFGELALLSPDEVRTASVIALEPTETTTIDREGFTALRKEHPAVTDMLVSLLAAQVRRLSVRLLEAHFVSADTRVLRRLLELTQAYGEGADGTVIPLTQEDVAGLAGTTRATVNRVLREEQGRGTVELARGKITVVDPIALARRAR